MSFFTTNYDILLRNKKSQPIQLTLLDQLPVSAISDITISATELSKGNINNETGVITWNLKLEPQRQTELNLQYEVKYPKKEKVILE